MKILLVNDRQRADQSKNLRHKNNMYAICILEGAHAVAQANAGCPISQKTGAKDARKKNAPEGALKQITKKIVTEDD